VGYIARTGSPGGNPDATPTANFPAIFGTANPLGAIIQAVWGNFAELFYYNIAGTVTGTWPSACYENGHGVAVRSDVDPASGFLSMFDVVVVDVSTTTLTLDVLRSASQGTAPGIIRIPGSVFRVDTSGTEASGGETAYLNVRVAPTTNNGNLGVSTTEFSVAQLVSADNPGTGGSAQVVADPSDPSLRELKIGVKDQQASNIVITEQVDDQLSNGQFTVKTPNGVEFTRAPVVSWDQTKGLQATLVTTTFPTNTITINVVGNAPMSGPGTIRISNIHFDLAASVNAGQVIVDIAPVLNTTGGQVLNGLDAVSLALGFAVTSVVVGEEGNPNVVQNVSVADGVVTLNLDVSPPTTVTGKLWIDLDVTPLFEGSLWVRPRTDALPTVDGFWVVLAAQDGQEVVNVDEFWYKSGSLSSTAAPATFLIGLDSSAVGQTITVRSSYSTDGFDSRITIQTVTMLIVN
jgi:hypothetical protein